MTETRRLGYWETIQKVFHDSYRCSGMIVQIARITGSLDPEILLRALSWLQQRHPMLRARLREESASYFYDIDVLADLRGQNLLVRVPLDVLQRQSENDCLRLAEREAHRDFDSRFGYQWRVVQLHGEQSSDVVFFIHHAIADGLSATRLAPDTLTLCGMLAEGVGLPALAKLPLLPCSDDLLDRTRPQEQAGAEEPPAIPDQEVKPWRFERTAPLEERTVGTIYRDIDFDHIAPFLARCKKENVAPSAAFTAAILRAVLQPPDSDANLSLSSPLNLRGLCSPPVGAERFGCYISVVQTVYDTASAAPFWDSARLCQKRLAAAVMAQQRQGLLPRVFHRAFVATAMQKRLAAAAEQELFCGGICYSNFGRLNCASSFGPFALTGLHCVVPDMAGFYAFYMSTFSLQGKFFCNVVHTEPLVSRETAASIVASVVDMVVAKPTA